MKYRKDPNKLKRNKPNDKGSYAWQQQNCKDPDIIEAIKEHDSPMTINSMNTKKTYSVWRN